MTKFYTNIEVRGDTVYYRGYENDVPVQQKIIYRPHLFVDTADQTSKYTLFNSTKRLVKREFESASAMKQFIDTYKDVPNYGIYGCKDISRQFIGNTFPGEIQWDYSKTKIFFFDIETCVSHLLVEPSVKVQIKRTEDSDVEIVTAHDLLRIPDTVTVYNPDTQKWGSLDVSGFVKSGFPDIARALEEINMISMYDHTDQKLIIWSVLQVNATNKIYSEFSNVDFRYFSTETELLKDFVTFFASTRIDILSGYNSELFDMPFLINRLTRVLGEGYTKLLSPWRNIKSRTIRFEDGKTVTTYDISGITHLDYLVLYKKFNPGGRESFKLDYIAEYELGKRKVSLGDMSFRDSYTLNEETIQNFIYYNAIDTFLLHELEREILQIRLAMQLGFMAKCPFADVVSAMRLWESIIYNYFLDIDIVEELDKEHNERHSIVGAYVHEPTPGKYGWTISVDATSKYPSIIMQNNLSPETIVDYWSDVTMDDVYNGKYDGKAPVNTILSANGLITSTEQTGFIPILIKRMFDLRKQTKNEMLDKKKHIKELEKANKTDDIKKLKSIVAALDVAQLAFKVASNSFYGCLALPHFKYYDYRLAEAVTTTGQVFIRHTMRETNDILNKILKTQCDYGLMADTDSFYFIVDTLVQKHCKNKTPDEIVTFLEKFVFEVIQPGLNKQLANIASRFGIKECKIFYKLECIGPNIIIIAKKRYAFDILYSEGVRYTEPEMKVMGMEIVRSSTPSAIKEFLRDSVKTCLRGTQEQLQNKLAKIKTEFMKLEYYDISFPRGVNGMDVYSDPAGIYKKGCPIHVRAALVYNNMLKKLGVNDKYPTITDGSKLKFVFLKMPNPTYENVIAFIDKFPTEIKLEKYIDYNTQFDKAFLAPIEGILDAIGWSAEQQVELDF